MIDDWTSIGADDEEMADYVSYLAEHPIDLNRATIRDLARIPHVTTPEAKSIVELRHWLGGFISPEQIALLERDGGRLHRKIAPFVRVNFSQHHSVHTRVRSIYEESHSWEGSAPPQVSAVEVQHLSATGCISPQLELGMLIEKKTVGDDLQKPISAYVEFHDDGALSHIVVGDFALHTGLGTAFSSGRQSLSAQVAGSSLGFSESIRGMAGRTKLFRGIAARAHAFCGGTEIGVGAFFARFLPSTDLVQMGEEEVSSPVEARDGSIVAAMAPTAAGGFVDAAFGSSVQLGACCSISPRDGLEQAGVNAGFNFGQATILGEAVTAGGGFGTIAGLSLNVDDWLDIRMLGRVYSAGFGSYGQPVSQFGDARNERGVYVAWDARPSQTFRLSGYLDMFSRLRRTGSSIFPVCGREILMETAIETQRWLSLRLQWRELIGESTFDRGASPGLLEKAQGKNTHRRIGVTGTFRLRRSFEVSTTVKYVSVGEEPDKRCAGVLFSHAFLWRTPIHMRLAFRVNSFMTELYDSRVYGSDGDLPGMFTNTPLFGRGRMWYFRADWDLSSALNIAVRYSVLEAETAHRAWCTRYAIALQMDARI